MDRNSEPHAGMLDLSFGEQGKAFPDTGETVNGVNVTPANHVLLAGRRANDYMIIRLQSNGRTDPSFGQNGIVTGKFQKGFVSIGLSASMTNDGRILLAGRYSKPGDISGSPALARHHQDGSLDTSFGDQGTLVIRYPIKPYETDARSTQTDGQSATVGMDKTLLLPDGKILVVSTHNFDYSTIVGVLARLNPDGSFDESFNDGKGFTVVKYQNNSTQLSTLLQQPDGKIIVAGFTVVAVDEWGLVARINADGTLDTHFGESGFFLTRGPAEKRRIFALASQSNGSIIAAGDLGTGVSALRCLLLGLTASGTFDPLFNKGQPLITQEDEHQLGSQWLSVATQPDSKIVVQGNTAGLQESDVILRRYSALGEPDLDFGDQTGQVRTEVGDYIDMGRSMTLDGTRIVVAGSYMKDANNFDFRPFALRYLA
ncbi:hypothetical protein [Pseudomonas frederiksbergensis]|uniref:Delta-60 repeat domain-containing protein n=1 Tax=Pseudomonas frederiksbergensis TaxID=104087 RepID=A0A423KDD0_9PSED|nr:hypothetical protein [Pseudomonas frederiksbergensis]RON50383.1 hypothetical protein BK665_21620 [Pseudomonas frederiksbergensis]